MRLSSQSMPLPLQMLSNGMFGMMAVACLGAVAVHGQYDSATHCAFSHAHAVHFGNQVTNSCPVYRSSCAASSCGDCVSAPDTATTVCDDGCIYTSGQYSVTRYFTGNHDVVYYDGYPLSSFSAGFGHSFHGSGVQGYFLYSYEVTSLDDEAATLVPALGGTCYFSFNGAQCDCQQTYCDAAQQIVQNRIDCTRIEGGAIINECTGVAYSDSLSLLEILYLVPYVACEGIDLSGAPLPDNGNAAPTTSSLSSAAPAAAAFVALPPAGTPGGGINAGPGQMPTITGPPAWRSNNGNNAIAPPASFPEGFTNNQSTSRSVSAPTVGLSLVTLMVAVAVNIFASP